MGARFPDCGEVGAEASASAGDHMAHGAVGIAKEELLAVGWIALRLHGSLGFLAAYVGDDLPDLGVGHADALAIGSIRRHGGTRDAVTDDLKHVGICVSMLFLGAREIRAAAASVGA